MRCLASRSPEKSSYAFPKQRKDPLTDAQHVLNAVARFDQVIDVSDADRDLAFANIEKAANYYDVSLAETSWHDLGIYPQKNRRASFLTKLFRHAYPGGFQFRIFGRPWRR